MSCSNYPDEKRQTNHNVTKYTEQKQAPSTVNMEK